MAKKTTNPSSRLWYEAAIFRPDFSEKRRLASCGHDHRSHDDALRCARANDWEGVVGLLWTPRRKRRS